LRACWPAGSSLASPTGSPSWWQVVLSSTASAITVVMVFAIQHTRRRQQLVLQRKLDELVRAQPGADDRKRVIRCERSVAAFGHILEWRLAAYSSPRPFETPATVTTGATTSVLAEHRFRTVHRHCTPTM
jgi:hypothetical protein